MDEQIMNLLYLYFLLVDSFFKNNYRIIKKYN